MTEKLRLLLADDHAILREGLAALIESEHDMEIVAQVASGREAIDKVRILRPDVAVLDVSMPDMGGADATEVIRSETRATRVIALTRHADQGYMQRMFRVGASGYVLKRSAGEALIRAIRAVANGDTWVDPSLAGPLMSRLAGQGDPGASVDATRGLTEREEQVLKLIAWGQSNKEVSTELGLSIKTVESYKATALRKLNLRSRTDIVRYALGQEWFKGEQSPDRV
ncbi:MAG: DNA-binding response regulator [Leptothrix sp. (in: Bacteria)]|nr:DNA-binding response regulator [Leptothrix sp. (in: b-proteobacteria)]